MFCKNCGKEIPDQAAVCISCGVTVGTGSKYCSFCGAETKENAAICLACGCALDKEDSRKKSEKTKITALLFALCLGNLGIHEFYLGYQTRGIIKIIANFLFVGLFFLFDDPLMTIGALGFMGILVWTIVEAVQIYTGKMKDAEGNELS